MNLFEGNTPQHIGHLVEDVDQVHSLLGDGIGAEISEPREFTLHPDVGAPATLRVVLAQVGDKLLEFIQPVSGDDNYWAQALRERGPGVHHIAYANFGDQHDDAIATLQQAGFELTVAGSFGGFSKWAYLEAPGVVFEIASGQGPSLAGPPARAA